MLFEPMEEVSWNSVCAIQGDERDRLDKECKEAVLSESMNRLNCGLDDANVSPIANAVLVLMSVLICPWSPPLAAAVPGAPALRRAGDPTGQAPRAGNATLRREQLVEAGASETPATAQPC